jgi:hypothetical protein
VCGLLPGKGRARTGCGEVGGVSVCWFFTDLDGNERERVMPKDQELLMSGLRLL